MRKGLGEQPWLHGARSPQVRPLPLPGWQAGMWPGLPGVAPANGAASWQRGQGPREQTPRPGNRLAGFRPHQAHQPQSDPKGAHNWPDATTWLPARHLATSACLLRPQLAQGRAPTGALGTRADHHQGPRGVGGVRRSPEQAAHGRASLGQMLPCDTVTRCTDSKDFFLLCCQNLLDPCIGQQNSRISSTRTKTMSSLGWVPRRHLSGDQMTEQKGFPSWSWEDPSQVCLAVKSLLRPPEHCP